MLTKLLCFKTTIYPRLVKMYSENLRATDNKLSCYVMHKHIVKDSKFFVNEFIMDPTSPMLTMGSFLIYRKKLAIDLLFPYQTLGM